MLGCSEEFLTPVRDIYRCCIISFTSLILLFHPSHIQYLIKYFDLRVGFQKPLGFVGDCLRSSEVFPSSRTM
ncbi:hypothetical protein BJX96DRAFT_157046 [Aspergillus floccosus]